MPQALAALVPSIGSFLISVALSAAFTILPAVHGRKPKEQTKPRELLCRS